ncbi:hypothetical protein AKO1_002781, partial [Acrasis kona]
MHPHHLTGRDIERNKGLLTEVNKAALERQHDNNTMYIAADDDTLVSRSRKADMNIIDLHPEHGLQVTSRNIFDNIRGHLENIRIKLCDTYEEDTMLSKTDAIKTILLLLQNPDSLDHKITNNQALQTQKTFSVPSFVTAWNTHIFSKNHNQKRLQPALTCYPNRVKEDASVELQKVFQEWITSSKIVPNHKDDFEFTYDTFISTKGCFTDAHYDPLTAYTVSRMRAGCKLFIQWNNSIENLSKFIKMPTKHYNSNNKYVWCFNNLSNPTATLYRAGDQVRIDANTIHCVFTLENSILTGCMFLDHTLSFEDVRSQLHNLQQIPVHKNSNQHTIFKTDIQGAAKIWVDHGNFSEQQKATIINEFK